jgi:hypothetical protein
MQKLILTQIVTAVIAIVNVLVAIMIYS